MSNVTVQATAHGVGIALKRANAIAGRQVVGRSLQPIVRKSIHVAEALLQDYPVKTHKVISPIWNGDFNWQADHCIG